MGCEGQSRFTGECPVAELMGGNIVDSAPPWWGVRAHCWVLKGQPRAVVFFGSGFRPEGHIAGFGRAGGLRWGLGFGGVFVNWIVDASI